MENIILNEETKVCPNSCNWPYCTLPLCMYKDPDGWAKYNSTRKSTEIVPEEIENIGTAPDGSNEWAE